MKKFWKFGLLAVTAAALIACGDDSSPGAPDVDHPGYSSNSNGGGNAGNTEYSSSSISAEDCSKLTATTVELSNESAFSQSGLNFETGSAESAAVTVVFNNDNASLKAAAGVQIYEEREQPYLAEGDMVCKEHFSTIGVGQESMEIETNTWYIVETPKGQYVVYVGKIMGSDKTVSVKVTYYK